MYSVVVIDFFIILVWIHGVTGIPVGLDQTGVESDRLPQSQMDWALG